MKGMDANAENGRTMIDEMLSKRGAHLLTP